MKSLMLMPIQQIKMNNIKRILSCLLAHGKGTKMELVSQTGLSNSTLSDCINNLCKLGSVKTDGVEESIGGRRPALYSLNAGYGYFLGIVIDANGVGGVITDFAGRLARSYPSHAPDGKPVIRLVYDMIEAMRRDYAGENLLAVGVGLEGVIDYELGIVANCEPIRWHNVHLKELIERKFFLPTYLDHKVNNAALYESLLGHATDVESFLLLCDDCPGKTCVYLNGAALRGERNQAGSTEHWALGAEELERLSRYLSLETVLLACRGDGDRPDGPPGLRKFAVGPDYLAHSAALMAECCWYESIYFQL